MNLYIARDGESLGPYSEADTKEFLRNGTVLPDELACAEGQEQWYPLHELFPSLSALVVPPPRPIAPSAAAAPQPAPEKLLWHGIPSNWNFLGAWFWGTILLPFGVGFFILLGAILRRRRMRFAVTTSKVGVETGLAVTSTQEVRICDIRSINVYRSGLAGFFGLGSVEFSTSANDRANVFFLGIREAAKVANIVRAIQDGRTPASIPRSVRPGSLVGAMACMAACALVALLCIIGWVSHAAAISSRSVVYAPPAQYSPVAQPPIAEIPETLVSPSTAQPAPDLHTSDGFAAAVAQSKQRALKAHPALGYARSSLNKAFVAAYNRLASTNSPRLHEPTWPEQLADECAVTVGSVATR